MLAGHNGAMSSRIPAHSQRCRIESGGPNLAWKTNAHLEVVAISSGLEALAGLDNLYRRVHLTDVWKHDGPFGETVEAHRQALEGKTVRFESRVDGRVFRFELTPLCDRQRQIVGVIGKAEEL